jgi:predicted oxidoreductase
VQRFNTNARAGKDPDFHRGESIYDRGGEPNASATLAPVEKGPFYGISVSPGALGTCGGLRVNRHAQVLDVWAEPITGLYASGNTSGVGGPGALYGGGGGTIGPALSFAFIAGKALTT